MTQRRAFGILVVFVGVLFLLSSLNLGIDGWDIFSMYWPVILIVIGLFNVVGHNGMRLSGIILIVIGCLFLVETTGIIDINMWNIIVPSMIILAGVWLLLPKSNNRLVSRHYIKQTALFSGASIACDSNEFKGAELFAAFGGIDLDLRRVSMGEDKPAKMDVFVAFGGIDIIVPEGFKVTVTGIPLFGGWSNKTNKSGNTGETDIVINALILFGGMEVKSKA